MATATSGAASDRASAAGRGRLPIVIGGLVTSTLLTLLVVPVATAQQVTRGLASTMATAMGLGVGDAGAGAYLPFTLDVAPRAAVRSRPAPAPLARRLELADPARDATLLAEAGYWLDAFDAIARIDSPVEADYYRNGGILQTVLRRLTRSAA